MYTIYNLPESTKDLVVARMCDGDWWFWGSWNESELLDAMAAANSIGGRVFSKSKVIAG